MSFVKNIKTKTEVYGVFCHLKRRFFSFLKSFWEKNLQPNIFEKSTQKRNSKGGKKFQKKLDFSPFFSEKKTYAFNCIPLPFVIFVKKYFHFFLKFFSGLLSKTSIQKFLFHQK